MEKLLTPREIAEILNVKPSTIYSWLSRDISLPPCIRIAGTVRWREATVKAWLEQQEKIRKRRNFE